MYIQSIITGPSKIPELASYLRRYGGHTDLAEHEWREAGGAETCREVWRVLEFSVK